ncbi:hypothetical protein B0H19DRAFT_1210906 [Mycena capillaripes]|nr:hypothetical protein B0H19DRAFT_1210906 [Mycena capillaripes]
MASPKEVLFLGATGYIGGTVLGRLLHHPRAHEFRVSALVRDPIKAEKLKAFGVTPVLGDLNLDLDLLETLGKDADVVFSINIPATNAILAGAKARFESTGRPTTYIHTSGAGAIADLTVHGTHKDGPTWDDLDEAQMATIEPTQLHRPIDLELLSADDEGYIKSYIILPTTVYGVASGPLVESGIQKPERGLLPPLIATALARGQAGMVGEGKNISHSIELRDIADLYITLYDDWLYFAENGVHELYQVGEIVARILFEHGKTESPVPTTFTQEEEDKYFPGLLASLIGCNVKCRANRARALGWRPTKSTSDFLACAEAVTTRYIAAAKVV